MFQQDGAPSHTSRVTHLEEVSPEFIKKDEWPPKSPDYSPMDCAIRDSLKAEVYREVQNKLTKQASIYRIILPWEKMSIQKRRKRISAWKKRLRLFVEKDGGHIEHRLNLSEINTFIDIALHFL